MNDAPNRSIMSDRLEMMQARMLDKGFGKVLGSKLVELDEGFCRMALPWREDLSRGDARVHGGVIAALIDKAGTTAAWAYTDIPEGTKGATVAMNVNFLEGAVSDMMAEARTVRRGGSIVVVDVDVLNDQGGKVAKGLVTYKLSRPRT
ncbi:MAG: PaaI family thioesterase [Alphaproteobacteria bacterium]|nr:PaaI family thioesterase [Alphaproteobacteria bacterium]